MQLLGHVLHVPRIDHGGAAQLLRGAGELAQEEIPAPVDARGDELLRDEVEPVAQGRHEAHVRHPVQRHEAVLVHAAELVMHRLIADPAVTAVDQASQRRDLALELLVVLDPETARHGHLEEVHAPVPLGVPLQEEIEGAQTLGDPLRVVHALHAEQQAPVAEGVGQALHLRRDRR